MSATNRGIATNVARDDAADLRRKKGHPNRRRREGTDSESLPKKNQPVEALLTHTVLSTCVAAGVTLR